MLYVRLITMATWCLIRQQISTAFSPTAFLAASHVIHMRSNDGPIAFLAASHVIHERSNGGHELSSPLDTSSTCDPTSAQELTVSTICSAKLLPPSGRRRRIKSINLHSRQSSSKIAAPHFATVDHVTADNVCYSQWCLQRCLIIHMKN